jgi:succinoglycan biosynthesis protein ExoM
MNQIIPRIDICIATYKRPHLLRKVLNSLLCQETEGKFSYGIIVSDNDNNRSAEPIVNEFANQSIRISYDVEPERNISLNRNRALSHASGDYIAIIDDDQYVGNRWLLSLFKTVVSFNADVVFGAIISVFEENTSILIRKSNAFGVPNFPEGFSGNMIYHTGNCCFRSEIISDMSAPFDSNFGDHVGEDTKFFETLRRKGCKMVWSHQAVCNEYIPPHRAKLSWLLNRYFQTGFMLFPTCGEERGCEIISLFQPMKSIHLLLKIAKTTLFFPLFMALSLVNTNYIPNAVNNLKYFAMYLGCSYYLLGRKHNG